MRPPAVEKLGYYPTTTTVVDLIKTYFAPAENGRLLDPCAGEGTAASILAKALNCASWGAELSQHKGWTKSSMLPGSPVI